MVERDIGNDNEISSFAHCGLCLEEFAEGDFPDMAPRDYASLEVGFTPLGVQVWCKRHEANVMHIDFQGQKHPANTERKADGEATSG